jgi:AraC-like DNA-binding protein
MPEYHTMIENITSVCCYRFQDTRFINGIPPHRPHYQLFFFLKENPGSFMHNGNWKDILSNRLFFISPGDDFTIRCADEAFKENGSVDCFYIAFDSPDKKPGGIHDYIIILQEFRADFIEGSIKVAAACLRQKQDEAVYHLRQLLEILDRLTMESRISFATRHVEGVFQDVPRHFHEKEYQIDYFAAGSGSIFINNRWVQYAPGFFCFIPPGITHEILLSQAPDIDNYSIKFRYVPDPRIGSPPQEAFALPAAEEKRPLILGVLKKIVGEYVMDIPVSPNSLKTLLSLTHEFRDCRDAAETEDLITRVKHLVSAAYSRPLRISDIAGQAGVSPEHLSRQFRKHSGLTLTAYINSIRLESSLYMLQNTAMPLKQIAVECGFKNVNYFTTQFKKHFSRTPMDVRKASVPGEKP